MTNNRIKSLSKLIAGTAQVFLVVSCVFYVGLTFFIFLNPFPNKNLHYSFEGLAFHPSDLSLTLKILIQGLNTVAIVISIKLMYHFRNLFRNFASGNIFTNGTISQIKHLGLTTVYFAALNAASIPVNFNILNNLATLQTLQHFSYTVRFPFLPLIFGALVFLVAWIVGEGKKLKDDSDLVI